MDEASKCPKCGKGPFHNNPKYCAGYCQGGKAEALGTGEHLHFACVVCGYEKIEPCRDAEA